MRRLMLAASMIVMVGQCHAANCFAHTSTWGGGNAAAHTSPPINTTGATILVIAMSSWTNYNLYIRDSVGNRDWQSTAAYYGVSHFAMILYKPNPITSTNYTFTIPSGVGVPPPPYGPGSNMSATLWACSGVTTDHPLAQQVGIGTSSGVWQPGAVTPLEPGDLIFAMGTVNTNPLGVTIDSGFVAPVVFWVSGYLGNASAWLSAPNTLPVNPTWTSSSTQWQGVLAVFRASTAPPPTSAGWSIGSVVGNGAQDFSGDGGPARDASVAFPGQIIKTSNGLHCFADVNNNRIRCFNETATPLTMYGVTIPPGMINTVAGSNTAVGFVDGVPPLSAAFAHPVGLWNDAADCLYIADQQNDAVRKMCPGGNVTYVAGRGTGGGTNPNCSTAGVGGGYNGFAGDGGPAKAALLNCPQGVAADAAGNIVISDTVNSRIRVVNMQATTQTLFGQSICAGCIQTVAGDGTGLCGTNPGAIGQPLSLMVDSVGDIIGTSYTCNIVYKIARDGRLSVLAGNGTNGFSGDGGPALDAQLYNPYVAAMAPNGDLYIGDTHNGYIRMVDHTTGNINTIAGNPTLYPPQIVTNLGVYYYGGGYCCDGSWANLAGTWYPIGLYIDVPSNRIYIGDLGTNRVRYLYLPPSPGATVTLGSQWASRAQIK